MNEDETDEAAPRRSTEWKKHWVGMPEFIQEKQVPFAKIIMRFRCQEDLDDFAAKIGQKLNAKSQCTWHPELPPPGRGPKRRYINES